MSRPTCQLLGSNHPSIWKFISALQKEQTMNELAMEQYIAGAAPTLGRRVYRDTAERIKTIVLDYAHRPFYWTICVASHTTLISKFDLDYFFLILRGFMLGFWIIFLKLSFLNFHHYLDRKSV